jgi:hypothetical protein
MKHKLTNWMCLVAHSDKDGNALPPCRRCDVCWEYIAHDKHDEECPGPKKGTNSEKMNYTDWVNADFIKVYEPKQE